MYEEDGLLRRIAADLNDDASRLVYADWLEESGDIDRANFIRIQIMIANGKYFEDGILLPATPEVVARFEARAKELLDQHRAEWEAGVRKALGASCEGVTFHRGFPRDVRVNSVRELIDSGILESNYNTLTGLSVNALRPQLPELLDHPGIGNLTTLNLWGNHIGIAIAEAIANSRHLTNLTTLDMGDNHIGTDGAEAIANSPHFAKLTALNLGYNGIETAGARAIANSPHLTNLTRLDLGGNEIGDAGAEALANSPHLTNLTTLNLWNNFIAEEGAEAIARSKHLANLTKLDLGHNRIGNAGGEAIANSPNLKNLTMLELWGTGIAEEGATAIAASPHLSAHAKISGLRSASFDALANQVERDARRYDGRE